MIYSVSNLTQLEIYLFHNKLNRDIIYLKVLRNLTDYLSIYFAICQEIYIFLTIL